MTSLISSARDFSAILQNEQSTHLEQKHLNILIHINSNNIRKIKKEPHQQTMPHIKGPSRTKFNEPFVLWEIMATEVFEFQLTTQNGVANN